MDGSKPSVSLRARCTVAAAMPIKTQSIIWTTMKYPLCTFCVCMSVCLVDNAYKNTPKAHVVISTTAVFFRIC